VSPIRWLGSSSHSRAESFPFSYFPIPRATRSPPRKNHPQTIPSHNSNTEGSNTKEPPVCPLKPLLPSSPRNTPASPSSNPDTLLPSHTRDFAGKTLSVAFMFAALNHTLSCPPLLRWSRQKVPVSGRSAVRGMVCNVGCSYVCCASSVPGMRVGSAAGGLEGIV
jgi:hypothetical protein